MRHMLLDGSVARDGSHQSRMRMRPPAAALLLVLGCWRVAPARSLPFLANNQKVWHTHISKCGMSFEREVKQNIKNGAYGLRLDKRHFYVPIEQAPTAQELKTQSYFTSVMFRDPRHHVVSLYNHCLSYRGQTWLSLRTPVTDRRWGVPLPEENFSQPSEAFYALVKQGGIRKWLEHFLTASHKEGLDDLGCYVRDQRPRLPRKSTTIFSRGVMTPEEYKLCTSFTQFAFAQSQRARVLLCSSSQKGDQSFSLPCFALSIWKSVWKSWRHVSHTQIFPLSDLRCLLTSRVASSSTSSM